MRVKNDTCIKSYQLTNTMFLTNEEFGIQRHEKQGKGGNDEWV